jgi:hypothetical protein
MSNSEHLLIILFNVVADFVGFTTFTISYSQVGV